MWSQTINQATRIYHAAQIKHFYLKFFGDVWKEKKPEKFQSEVVLSVEKTQDEEMDEVRLLNKEAREKKRLVQLIFSSSR